MKDHTDLLNHLVAKHNLTDYLEIGVQNPANNFNKINVLNKDGIDPNPKARALYCMESDYFFDMLFPEDRYHHKYDLIFIDGLHHADQVERDFNNSLRFLEEDGFIVIHDTCPESESLTAVPRIKRGRWLGDVYKFVMRLNRYDGIDFCTYDFDNGCTVVWRDEEKKGCPEIINSLEPLNWQAYQDRSDLMRVTQLSLVVKT